MKNPMAFSLLLLSLSLLLLLPLGMIGCVKPTDGMAYNSHPEIVTGPATERVTDFGRLTDTAIKIVRQGLGDENSYIRSNAIEVVSNTGRNELMPMVTELLKDKVMPVRFHAALAIGDRDYRPGEYAVAKLLNDENKNIRIAAAYVLAKFGRTGYVNTIRKATASSDPTVGANAALLLGKLGDKSDVPLLYDMLGSMESSSRAKIQAIDSIAMLGDEQIYRKKLWPLLISKHPDERVMGIKGMAALGTLDAKDAILTMFSDDVLEVRLCAAEQLGRLGDHSGQAIVAEYLSKISPARTESLVADTLAIFAIGTIGTESLTRYLPYLLRHDSRVIRMAAAQSVLILAKPDERR